MVRDAHLELAKAINKCAQNVMAHIEEEKIPSKQLPVALRDHAMSRNFAKSFAGQCMIDWLIGCIIRAARGGDTESVEMLCSVAYETCAVLRDIVTKHSGTDAQRDRLSEIAKCNSAFPLLVRLHTKANREPMEVLRGMGLGAASWIDADKRKKFGVDSDLNRYLVRSIPHVQRFCQININGSIHQNAIFALPSLESCSDSEKAKNAFDNAKKLFHEIGPPRRASAKQWVKQVFVPLIESGFGDPFDISIVPSLSDKKLVGLGNDKTDRSPNERLFHYVLKALNGMLRD